MMMIFIWQRSQATRKGTSPSMLAARTKKIYIVSYRNDLYNLYSTTVQAFGKAVKTYQVTQNKYTEA